jgi:hypothetical protein
VREDFWDWDWGLGVENLGRDGGDFDWGVGRGACCYLRCCCHSALARSN